MASDEAKEKGGGKQLDEEDNKKREKTPLMKKIGLGYKARFFVAIVVFCFHS